jgi:hypothetical protein
MLSYETISDALLDSAEQVGLNVWQSDEAIDPHSLLRTFTLTCLPLGQGTPRPQSIQASLSFQWDAAMTAISTLGTEALCERYHADNVACSHALVGCAYETALTLNVSYAIPVQLTLGDDLTVLPRLVRSIQDMHRGMIDHKNVVRVDANVQFTGSEIRVSQLKAQQVWTIGDPIHELDGLEDVFEDACSEVRDLLMTLTGHFAAAGLPEADELLMSLPMDLVDDERIYLRPPTA